MDVNAPDQDSSATSLMIAAGAGSYAYVTRGCEGQVLSRTQYRFRDAGFALNHRFDGPLEAGVRVNALRQMPDYPKNTVIVDPNVSVEGERAGFGVGLNFGGRKSRYDYERVFEILPVSGHVRLGPRRTAYFSAHVFEDVPLISSGSPLRTCLGFRVEPVMDGWIGAGLPVPYDRIGLVAKADLHVTRFLDLNLSGRLGGSEGLSENAGAVGITLRRSRVEP